MIQCTQALDRAARALAVELYATRARLYDAMTQLLPAVQAGIHPEDILYPRRTQIPAGIGWPAVGGRTIARGPVLPAQDRVLHLSAYGAQDPSSVRIDVPHGQLPRFRDLSRR